MEIIFVVIVFVSMIIGWVKIGARNDTSKTGAKYAGSLIYTDFEGKTRLVSNDHLCSVEPMGGIGGIYIRDCDNTELNPICDVNYTDLKTKKTINPAIERAKQLLKERLQKAKETNNDELIFVIKRFGSNYTTYKERIKRREKNIEKQINDIKQIQLDKLIEGNCYCLPTSTINDSVYDKWGWTNKIEQMYVVKSISKADHPNWFIDFYMSIETGLLYKPTEAQLKMERFIKKNLGDEYKSFSDEELQLFMNEFNEEQLKRQKIALNLAKQTIFVDDIARIYYNNTVEKQEYKNGKYSFYLDDKFEQLHSNKYAICIGDNILDAEKHGYLKYNKYDFSKETPYMKEVEERRI